MRIRLFLCLALLVFLVSFAAVVVDDAVAKGCMAGGCHQQLTQVKYMHGPVAAEMAGVKGCEMCHVLSGRQCSASRGGSYKVKIKGLCVTCHDKGAGTQHSAKEIESKCLKCHGPHGSDKSRYMLRDRAR